MSASGEVRVMRLGCRDFGEVRRLQEELVAERRADRAPDTVLLCSHPPVVTAGRGSTEEEVLAARQAVAAHGMEVVRCERGGRLTYHYPGQIIAYPIFRLSGPDRDLHAYLRRLEDAVIGALAEVGLAAGIRPGHAGVWVEGAKIAALGVAVRGWVTWHGLALNFEGDLGPFGLITPCGVPGLQVTSVQQELGGSVGRAQVEDLVVRCLLSLRTTSRYASCEGRKEVC